MTTNVDKKNIYFRLFLMAVGVIITMSATIYAITVGAQGKKIEKNSERINNLQANLSSIDIYMARMDERLSNIESAVGVKTPQELGKNEK